MYVVLEVETSDGWRLATPSDVRQKPVIIGNIA